MSQDFKVRYMFSLTEEAQWPEHSPVLPKLVGQALWKLEAVGDDIWLPARCNPERVFRKEQWTMIKLGEEFRIMQSKRGYLHLRKEVLPEGITFEQSMNPFMRDNGSGSTELHAQKMLLAVTLIFGTILAHSPSTILTYKLRLTAWILQRPWFWGSRRLPNDSVWTGPKRPIFAAHIVALEL